MFNITELTNDDLRIQIKNRKKRGDYDVCAMILNRNYEYTKQVVRGVRDNRSILEDMILVIEAREAMEKQLKKTIAQRQVA